MILPRMAFAAEQRRRLAVAMTLDGETPEQVADLLRVSERSVWRWLGAFREQGDAGLLTRPGQGRPYGRTTASSTTSASTVSR